MLIGAAATWGIYSSRSEEQGSNAMHDEANRRQRQYEAAKSRSCVPNPDPKPTGTCSELSKTIDTLQEAVSRYKWFDGKYTPGRHDAKLENLENRINSLKARYSEECTGCK